MRLCVGSKHNVCDDGFTEKEILEDQKVMLSVLEYDLKYPSPMDFLRRISKVDDLDIEAVTPANTS